MKGRTRGNRRDMGVGADELFLFRKRTTMWIGPQIMVSRTHMLPSPAASGACVGWVYVCHTLSQRTHALPDHHVGLHPAFIESGETS